MIEGRDSIRDLHSPGLDLADALRSLNAELRVRGTEYSVEVTGRERGLHLLVCEEIPDSSRSDYRCLSALLRRPRARHSTEGPRDARSFATLSCSIASSCSSLRSVMENAQFATSLDSLETSSTESAIVPPNCSSDLPRETLPLKTRILS
jgi:hypothetical protein